MDNLSKLSKADVKLLNRLRIPREQKLLLENYWQANPVVTNKYKVVNVCVVLTQPLIIATLASQFFLSGMLPFINIAIVLLWVFNLGILAVHLGITVVSALMAADNQDEMMNRSFAAFLPGGSSFFRKVYSTFTWVATFGLTASEGHFITAGMVVLCWLATKILNKFCAAILTKFFEKRVKETPVDEIVRTITLRMNNR